MQNPSLGLVLSVFLVVSAASGDPVDTAYDVLDAVTYGDGYALEELLTEDLYSTLTGFLDQVRDIAAEDPALAENLLNQRYSGRITVSDFEILNNEELLGKLMVETSLQPVSQVDRETAQLEGRAAEVVLYYFNGASVSFSMVWENSSWRVSDSSLLAALFQ